MEMYRHADRPWPPEHLPLQIMKKSKRREPPKENLPEDTYPAQPSEPQPAPNVAEHLAPVLPIAVKSQQEKNVAERELYQVIDNRLSDVYDFLEQEGLSPAEHFTPATLLKAAGYPKSTSIPELCLNIPLELVRLNRTLSSYTGRKSYASRRVNLEKTYFNQTLIALETAYQKRTALKNKKEKQKNNPGIIVSIDNMLDAIFDRIDEKINSSKIIAAIDGFILSTQNKFNRDRLVVAMEPPPEISPYFDPHTERNQIINPALREKEALELLAILLEPYMEQEKERRTASSPDLKDQATNTANEKYPGSNFNEYNMPFLT